MVPQNTTFPFPRVNLCKVHIWLCSSHVLILPSCVCPLRWPNPTGNCWFRGRNSSIYFHISAFPTVMCFNILTCLNHFLRLLPRVRERPQSVRANYCTPESRVSACLRAWSHSLSAQAAFWFGNLAGAHVPKAMVEEQVGDKKCRRIPFSFSVLFSPETILLTSTSQMLGSQVLNVLLNESLW